MYGWYLFATVINNHADQAATVIIQDTFKSKSAHDIKVLRDIKKNIVEGDAAKAISLTDKAIDDKLYLLELCLTEVCDEISSNVNNK